ncbi:MAG: electron transfer flavoprotein subunit beta/FixA family protein [Kiritimatiellae bacterium]|nr:electron transfer flavoprotein subunit beta/FixA family protein [Kiritimatiellia bacterium]MBR0198470.1 electron transfer flavoprotein subunit beta/FixA family protein [Kiritimatiellia bacterium]
MNACNNSRVGGYNCVVCIKQVPDTKKVTGEAMKADGTINRAALPAIFNPEDRNALEAALKVKEIYGGKVTAIAMGLPAACEILREALMCGADEAYLVTDRKAAGSDTLATSYILSCAVKKFNPDLVFCGRQAIDGDTAQTGPQIAEKLGFAAITYLEDLEMDGDWAIATRDIGTGIEKDRVKLPALFTVTEKFGELRPFNVHRVMKYKKAKAPIENGGVAPEGDFAIGQLSCDDIGAEADRCGFAGSPTNVNKIVSVVLAGGDYKDVAPTDEGIKNLVDELIADHTIG